MVCEKVLRLLRVLSQLALVANMQDAGNLAAICVKQGVLYNAHLSSGVRAGL